MKVSFHAINMGNATEYFMFLKWESNGVFLSVNPKMEFRSKNGFCVPFGKSKSGFLIW